MTVVLGGAGSPVGLGSPLGTFTDGSGAGSTTVTTPGITSSTLRTIACA